MAGWEGAHPEHRQALCFLCSVLVCLFLSPFIACLCPSAASQLYAQHWLWSAADTVDLKGQMASQGSAHSRCMWPFHGLPTCLCCG